MVMKIVAISALVIAGLALTGRHVDHNDRSRARLVADIVWRGHGAGAFRLWRMADGELPRGGSERAEEKPAPRTAAGSAGVVVLYLGVNWVCLRALGPQALAATTTPATAVMRMALGQKGRNVYCGGNRHLDSGVSEPVDPDRAARVLCHGR